MATAVDVIAPSPRSQPQASMHLSILRDEEAAAGWILPGAHPEVPGAITSHSCGEGEAWAEPQHLGDGG